RIEDAAGFPRCDEQEPERLVERRWHPVGAATLIGTHPRPLFTWDAVRKEHVAAVGLNLLRPARLDEWLRPDQLPGRPVEKIEEAIAVLDHHALARLTADRQVGQDGVLGRVPVPHVVWREL